MQSDAGGQAPPERTVSHSYYHHNLVDIFRARAAEAASAAMHEHLEHNESIALRALDLDRS
ncbi:hypothetical protein [Sporichthya sp.]|uniref:hypothetical protein n=1 Tax=Sporichthya sp. TaxID=65475 RepID=UPI0018245DC5|nr:hypothetical protein [Sporichthya sp.]MBA3741615.1 hypothetical protein [Sporichthya sp.]